jgi:hypothetical protein
MMRIRPSRWSVMLAILAAGSPILGAQSGPALSLDSGSAAPGGTVSLDMHLVSPASSLPAALEWTVSYPPGDVISVNMAAGAGLMAADKTIACNAASGSTICLAYGINANWIANGVVAVVTVTLSATAGDSIIPLSMGNTSAAAADGSALPVQATGTQILLQSNPTPAVASLSPSTIPAGAAAFTLLVTGSGFVPGSVVNWNGSARPTSFIDSTGLQAAISASDVGSAGTVPVSVSNPAPGVSSASFPFTVTGSPATVPSGPPSPLGVVPAAGNGFGQPMTFTFSDPRGWADLNVVNILINDALDGRQACYLAFNPSLNVLYLVNDAGSALLPELTLNGAGGLGNSQCSVKGAGSAVTSNGTDLNLNLNLSFSASFAGNKVLYLAARDLEGNNSGWQPLGTWEVPGTPTTPAAGGVSPARGLGSTQTFAFTFTDGKGYQDLGIVDILINSGLDGRHACYIAYSQPDGLLFLVDDSGTALLPAMALNSGGSLTNSQCSVSGAGLAGGGTTLVLTLNLSFSASFSGDMVIYLAARDLGDVNNSGWQPMGTWTAEPYKLAGRRPDPPESHHPAGAQSVAVDPVGRF